MDPRLAQSYCRRNRLGSKRLMTGGCWQHRCSDMGSHSSILRNRMDCHRCNGSWRGLSGQCNRRNQDHTCRLSGIDSGPRMSFTALAVQTPEMHTSPTEHRSSSALQGVPSCFGNCSQSPVEVLQNPVLHWSLTEPSSAQLMVGPCVQTPA